MNEVKPQRKFSGRKLKGARLAIGMSRMRLAVLAECTPQSILNWETGVYVPGADSLELLAVALRKSVGHFYE